MVKVSFPYVGVPPLMIPKGNLLGIFSPSELSVEKSFDALIRKALAEPVGKGPLREQAAGKKKVLVVVDDGTRMTPVKDILPYLLDELGEGRRGFPEVTFMIGLGTHQPMMEDEIIGKVGDKVFSRYPVLNHAWWDPSQLDYLGDTDSGIPVVVNRLAKEADLIIGIGQIVPHRVTGFSGGGNIVQPGICGELTTGKTHWLAAQFTGKQILGKVENPVKQEIEKIAHQAGLSWIINCMLDGSGRLADIAAGDPRRVYRVGSCRVGEDYRSVLPREADIVMVDSHPYDSELWVASKGILRGRIGRPPGRGGHPGFSLPGRGLFQPSGSAGQRVPFFRHGREMGLPGRDNQIDRRGPIWFTSEGWSRKGPGYPGIGRHFQRRNRTIRPDPWADTPGGPGYGL